MAYRINHWPQPEEVRNSLEEVAVDIIIGMLDGVMKPLKLTPRREWEYTIYDHETGALCLRRQFKDRLRWFYNTRGTDGPLQYLKTVLLMQSVHESLRQPGGPRRLTLRETHYLPTMLPFFEDEVEVNQFALDVSGIVKHPRDSLQLDAAGKGVLIGPIKILDKGILHDCQLAPKLIPGKLREIQEFEFVDYDRVRYILVVEKEAALQRMLDSHIQRYLPSCLLMTGLGEADIATRYMLKRLTEELGVPAFCFTDGDPYGIQIFLTYKFGSKEFFLENSKHNTPGLIWIGMLPTELEELPDDVLARQPLKPKDIEYLEALLHNHPYVRRNAAINEQVRAMLRLGWSAEIEGFDGIHHCLPYIVFKLSHFEHLPVPLPVAVNQN